MIDRETSTKPASEDKLKKTSVIKQIGLMALALVLAFVTVIIINL